MNKKSKVLRNNKNIGGKMKKARMLVLTLVTFVMVFVGLPGVAQAGWQYKKAITITNNTGQTLTDYQVLVVLDNTNFNYTHLGNVDGDDIRFSTDETGSSEPDILYWIESWKQGANNESKLWTKVTSIPTSGITIYMYYGNPSASSASNGDSTFVLYNISGIVGLWHMDEDSWNGTSGEVKDETGLNNGTAQDNATTTPEGKFGRAGNFDGNHDYVLVLDSDNLDMESSVSLVAWVYPKNTSQNDLIKKYRNYYMGTLTYPERAMKVGFNCSSTKCSWTRTVTCYLVNEWVHFVGVNGNSTYVNGVNKKYDSGSSGETRELTNPLEIGWNFYGYIDEVMLFNRGLGEMEIQQIYNNYVEKMGSVYNARKYVSPEPLSGIGDESEGDYTLPVELISGSLMAEYAINEYGSEYVVVKWTTASETDIVGFNIYRSEDNDFANPVKITSDLIPGTNTSTDHEYTYHDETIMNEDIQAGDIYWYWLGVVELGGSSYIYDEPCKLIIPDDYEPPVPPDIPIIYGLYQNCPNPFNPTNASKTKVFFCLEKSTQVEINVYNIRGEFVRCIYKGPAEFYENNLKPKVAFWDGKDENGIEQTTGVYLYELKVNDEVNDIKRLMLLR